MHFRPLWFQVAVLTAACGLGSCFGRISSSHRLFLKKKKRRIFNVSCYFEQNICWFVRITLSPLLRSLLNSWVAMFLLLFSGRCYVSYTWSN